MKVPTKTEVTVRAVVTRANGTIEDLGIVAQGKQVKTNKSFIQKLISMVKGSVK
jgi:hypothetical protein